ncbi:MAG: hypothetical protein KGP28_11345, partial [Bdellovibrionales bacterium]|nr:hypothetical protein [Bdellovibrionales bacterium]
FWLGPSRLLELFQEWLRCLAEQQSPSFISGNINQSLAAAISRWLDLPEAVGVLSASALVIYSMCLIIIKSRQKPDLRSLGPGQANLFLAFGLSSYLVCSPLSWRWAVFNWVPVVLVLWRMKGSEKSLITWALIALLSQGFIGRHFDTLHEDAVSWFGLYALASLILWIASLFRILQVHR